jgi:hypothetical protein
VDDGKGLESASPDFASVEIRGEAPLTPEGVRTKGSRGIVVFTTENIGNWLAFAFEIPDRGNAGLSAAVIAISTKARTYKSTVLLTINIWFLRGRV